MKVDELDYKIIEILASNDKVTSYKVTKEIFKNIKDVRIIRDKKRPIDSRLNKLVKYGIININNVKNIKFYSLDKNNIIFSDNAFIKIKNKKYKVSNKVILFKVNNEYVGVLI